MNEPPDSASQSHPEEMETQTMTGGEPTNGLAKAPELKGEGRRIKNYRLIEKLGEGGFGTVWRAAQEEPVKRQVALKILKPGMDSREIIARFEQERQALAVMDHPHIARVFDAGTTEAGRPYFVMELVSGSRITHYCDEQKFSTTARLELFIAVCEAVQHAHQKGIIHRDLKPSNILVTAQDGKPVPKVIDFGIAKATGPQLTDLTMLTQLEQRIGTPLYMSPEQAGGATDVDTRSDIYSLGVVLYELLAGRLPFDPQQLLRMGVEEMRRILREEDPPKPSTAVNSLDDAQRTAVAQRRRTESARLRTQLGGDLDWIVMKALEKDRTRRYESAAAFAEDLHRHLKHEPVAAGPPARLYRLGKFMRRHKVAFVAGTAVAAAVLGGLGISLWMYFEEKSAREAAVAAERKAERTAQTSERVRLFNRDLLYRMSYRELPGSDAPDVIQVIDDTAGRIPATLKGEPEAEAEIRQDMGLVYSSYGLYAKSEGQFRRAVELSRVTGDGRMLASALQNLGNALTHSGQTKEAAPLLLEAAALLEPELERMAQLPPDAHLAKTLSRMAMVQNKLGNYTGMESLLRRQLRVEEEIFGLEASQIDDTLGMLAVSLRAQSRGAEVEAVWRDLAGRTLRRSGADSLEHAMALHRLALCLAEYKKHPDALPAVRQAVDIRRKLLPADTPLLADTLRTLGTVLHATGDTAGWEAAVGEMVSIYRKTRKAEDPYLDEQLRELAAARREVGDTAGAVSPHREILARASRRSGGDSVEAAYEMAVLAQLLLDLREFAEAESLARRALAIRKQMQPDDVKTFVSKSVVGACLLAQQKYAEAEPLLLDGYAGMKARESAIPAKGRKYLIAAAEQLMRLYEATDQASKSAEWQRTMEVEKAAAAQ